MKRTIEIVDTLGERVEEGKEQLRAEARAYLIRHPETKSSEELHPFVGGWIMDIADSLMPTREGEVDALYYFHGNELIDAAREEGRDLSYESAEGFRRNSVCDYLTIMLRGFENELAGYVDATILFDEDHQALRRRAEARAALLEERTG